MTTFGAGVIVGKCVVGPSSDFSPSDLSGLFYWHDMQDAAAYVLNAGAVESITNKVSGVVTTQATSTQRPTYSATGLNGYPCGDYDGAATGDQFVGTEAAVYTPFNDDKPYTLFYVAKHDVADAIQYVFAAGGAGTSGFRSWGTNTTASGVWLGSYNSSGGAANNVESTVGSDTSPHVFEWWGTGGLTSSSRDGGAADPDAEAQVGGPLTLTKFSVGVRSRGATEDGDLNGLIGEILAWSRELSAAERAQVRAYLGAKWGISVVA